MAYYTLGTKNLDSFTLSQAQNLLSNLSGPQLETYVFDYFMPKTFLQKAVLTHPDPNIRVLGACSRKLEDKNAIILAIDPDVSVRIALAMRIRLPLAAIMLLAKDKDPLVREKLAKSIAIPTGIRYKLAKDPIPAVRMAMTCLQLEPKIDALLLKDPNPELRVSRGNHFKASAQKLLTDPLLNVRHQMVHAWPELLTPAVVKTLDMAWALAPNPIPPYNSPLGELYYRDNIDGISLTKVPYSVSIYWSPAKWEPGCFKEANPSLAAEISTWPVIFQQKFSFYIHSQNKNFQVSTHPDRPYKIGKNWTAEVNTADFYWKELKMEKLRVAYLGQTRLPQAVDGWAKLESHINGQHRIHGGYEDVRGLLHDWFSSVEEAPPVHITTPIKAQYLGKIPESFTGRLVGTVIYSNGVYALWKNSKGILIGWTIEQNAHIPPVKQILGIEIIQKDRVIRLSVLEGIEKIFRTLISNQMAL